MLNTVDLTTRKSYAIGERFGWGCHTPLCVSKPYPFVRSSLWVSSALVSKPIGRPDPAGVAAITLHPLTLLNKVY